MKKERIFLEGIYRRSHPVVKEGFIGLWELIGKDLTGNTIALSLRRNGSGYSFGGPIGYLQKRYCIINKPLSKVRLEDFFESGFIYFEEELQYHDFLWKASAALNEYADLRSREV